MDAVERKAKAGAEVARRRAERADADRDWAALLERVRVGDVVAGTVTRIERFGAFVEVEGCAFPGLIRLPTYQLAPGESVICEVVGLDGRQQTFLSLRGRS